MRGPSPGRIVDVMLGHGKSNQGCSETGNPRVNGTSNPDRFRHEIYDTTELSREPERFASDPAIRVLARCQRYVMIIELVRDQVPPASYSSSSKNLESDLRE